MRSRGRGARVGYRVAMGCLVVLLALVSARLALFFVWIFDNSLLDRAFDEWWVPLAGFFILPWTTLAYTLCFSSGNRVVGFEWFLVGFAFLVDVSTWFGGRREQAARR